MSLTKRQCEYLIQLIKAGKNTYADIHKLFPGLSDDALKEIIGDSFKGRGLNADIRNLHRERQILINFIKCPENYTKDYIFKDSDTFELSVYSENILYQLQKERIAEEHFQDSLSESKQATKYAKRAYFATIIFGIISIIGIVISVLNTPAH